METLRKGAVVAILALFAVSVFTRFPEDGGTRATLGVAFLAVAGFLFGPSVVRRGTKKEEDE